MTDTECPRCKTQLVRGFGLGGLRGSYSYCPNEDCKGEKVPTEIGWLASGLRHARAALEPKPRHVRTDEELADEADRWAI